MYISKIELVNFKGFEGANNLKFGAGMNFFVGDNNCGKSSIFEAVDFIRTKRERNEVITKSKINTEDFVSVMIEFSGEDIESVLEIESLKKYKPFLLEIDGEKVLRVMRSSLEEVITQSGKEKSLSISNVRIFNPLSDQFENPTGIDTTISALFDAQFVWADTDSGDVSDFAKTKISGKIINTITKDFTNSPVWESFRRSHEETFGEGENSLSETLKPVEEKIKNILSDQYGETEVRFSFSLPEIDNFFKTGNITLSEGGVETKSSEKGTGMQRALALALIQVYADISSGSSEKPLLFFIDEPETFLHPRAQDKLLDSLEKISEKTQVFIVTHSPYLLRKYKKETHTMTMFSKQDGLNKIVEGSNLNLFGKSSPSWGEINYYAFGVTSVEFHNELFGFAQASAISEDLDNEREEDFDKYLVSKGFIKDKKWIPFKNGSPLPERERTLPTYIRNIIHHPENSCNKMYSEDELRESISKLITLLGSEKQN